jgi:hypothetical protein
MAFNLARQLGFRQGFIPYHRTTHFPRKFGHTVQRKVIDELIGEVPMKHEAPKMSELERLASLETEVGIHRKAINDGFSRIEGWIKLLVSIAGGTILFGFGGSLTKSWCTIYKWLRQRGNTWKKSSPLPKKGQTISWNASSLKWTISWNT